MQTFGQMARVPVTARQKFEEAAYFYNGMVTHRLNVIIFPYYLSAFLSAFRSVTYYMQKQYAHDAKFQAWYPQKQADMAADAVLKVLHDNRNEIVHREQIDLFFYRDFQFPARFGGCIETKHIEVRYDQAPDGESKTRIKVAAAVAEEEVATRISWRFTEDDKVDAAQHCYLGLQKLDAMLKELELLCTPYCLLVGSPASLCGPLLAKDARNGAPGGHPCSPTQGKSSVLPNKSVSVRAVQSRSQQILPDDTLNEPTSKVGADATR